MTYQDWLEAFAYVVLVCVGIVVTIDLLAEFKVQIALKLKWSIAWYVLRYTASGCALALAINVVKH